MLYSDPLQGRYGNEQMKEIWTDFNKITIWRELWVSLASAQKSLGMIDISDASIRKMLEESENIDLIKIHEYEKKTGHDVYAAILEFRDVCGPVHGKYIHLGATSQFVVDNADCIRIRDSLNLISDKTKILLNRMCIRAESYKDTPCVGYTHGQKAQITTIGRRIAMWGEAIKMSLEHMEYAVSNMKWRGAKGAVGNQTGYCYIDQKKAAGIGEYLDRKFRFDSFICIGQTYHRSQDVLLFLPLSSLVAAVHKMGQDIRLLCSMDEMSEKRVEVGSSAMPYKNNPIISEKICSLSKMVNSMMSVFADTASNQWLERSLDDSANRRISFPKMFLMVDEILDCCIKLIDGCTFYSRPDKINIHLPHAIMEWAVTKAVLNGYDRAEMHEKMRSFAESSYSEDQLINHVLGIPELKGIDTKDSRCVNTHLGNSISQTEEFIDYCKKPKYIDTTS